MREIRVFFCVECEHGQKCPVSWTHIWRKANLALANTNALRGPSFVRANSTMFLLSDESILCLNSDSQVFLRATHCKHANLRAKMLALS